MTEFEKFLSGKEFIWKPGLERVRSAISELPVKKGKSVIVAGTNGKGSTAFFLSSILKEHGLKVGLFTSPHLRRINERFRINLKEIPDRIIDEAFHAIQKLIERHSLTYFESCFLLALYLFKECDISVFEVGMGGRLDATNAVKHDLAVITHIDYDHEKYLGKTISEIATEKLHVASEIPAVISRNRKEVIEVAKRFSKKLFIYGKDFSVKNVKVSISGTEFTYYDDDSELKFQTGLIGEHQAVNASTAIFSSKLLLKSTEIEKIANGLSINLEGRFQVIRRNPLIIIDVAHNTDAVENLVKTLKKLSLNVDVIYSGLKDKDIGRILKILHEYTHSAGTKLFVTQIKGDRGLSCEELMKISRSLSIKAFPIHEVNLDKVKNDTLITGSFYLLSQIQSA